MEFPENFWKKLHKVRFIRYIWFVTYFVIFIFQLLFNIFKVLEIKYTYENKLIPLLLNTVWINLLSIGSVYYSLEGLLGGDVFVIVFYVDSISSIVVVDCWGSTIFRNVNLLLLWLLFICSAISPDFIFSSGQNRR